MGSSFLCIIREGFKQIVRNKAMSLASVFSITAMLLILGVFFAFIVNINVAMEAAKQDYDTVQIYLLEETDKFLVVFTKLVRYINYKSGEVKQNFSKKIMNEFKIDVNKFILPL